MQKLKKTKDSKKKNPLKTILSWTVRANAYSPNTLEVNLNRRIWSSRPAWAHETLPQKTIKLEHLMLERDQGLKGGTQHWVLVFACPCAAECSKQLTSYRSILKGPKSFERLPNLKGIYNMGLKHLIFSVNKSPKNSGIWTTKLKQTTE